MKSLARTCGIAAFGVLTSLLAAFVVVAISHVLGISLFTFCVGFLFPIGAIATGITLTGSGPYT